AHKAARPGQGSRARPGRRALPRAGGTRFCHDFIDRSRPGGSVGIDRYDVPVSGNDGSFAWPAASATGVGSMPGTDPREAMAVVIGERPDLHHRPELPARGPGADMIGRTVDLLVDMPAQTTPRGWRLAAKPGRDASRAASFLSADLDVME